mgnify:CR=1 FL=1
MRRIYDDELKSMHAQFTKMGLMVNENILLSRNDWDSFETSWDFKKHPLI